MKVVYMGTPDFAVGALEAIIKAGHEVCAVITQPDKPVGRKQELVPTPVKACAQEAGIPVYQPQKLRNNPEILDTLKELDPEVIVVAAYGKIIPSEILQLPKYGCLNIHASLLPKYRGAAPIQWAVIDGEEKSGVTIMQMDDGLDTGDMLAVREVVLTAEETGGSLFDRLAEAGAELIVEILPELGKGTLTAVPQPAESTTAYARMITKADGRIDWSKDAAAIERLVRGLNPWPSAFTALNGKSLKIWNSCVVDTEMCSGTPGEVLQASGEEIRIATGKGVLAVTELQLEGKKRMKVSDFLRGRSVETGTILG
ncbi:MAG: methionyl-tRNA formyltransferase [Eubacteriales bacterium]|nr:methionyl-tRNA formyltransferase [Eubacteriales bacterium]